MKYWKTISADIQNQMSKYSKCGRGAKNFPWNYESDEILTLDLEATSAFKNEDGSLEVYKKGMSETYWNNKTAVGCEYIWMCYLQDDVYYGRFLEEIEPFLKIVLDEDTHYIIYLHNFGYDFSFLQNVFHFTDVFAREERHPMKAFCEELPFVEFRCSYTLTGLSLEDWGKKIGYEKAVGDLDYNQLRTPLTPLTEKELGYCERDVRVQAVGLQEYLEKYGHIKDIPLTLTGEVRREIRSLVCGNKQLQKKLVKLVPKVVHMYGALKKAFAGGYTHANVLHVGDVVIDGCAYDFSSFYPSMLCAMKYPSTPWKKCMFSKNANLEDTAYLMRVRYENLEVKTYNHYISESKCLVKSDGMRDFVRVLKDGRRVPFRQLTHPEEVWEVDNGRLVKADYCELWITEQDYLTIKETYKYDMRVLECYSSEKKYLPMEIIIFILMLYGEKTKYKDVEGYEKIYQRAKSMLNSIFGMMVTDFINDDILFFHNSIEENGKKIQWKTEEKTEEEVQEVLNDLIENNKGRTFNSYSWGVWCTAYSRRQLFRCILTCDERVVYCDTDSLKIIGEQDFSWYNEEITNRLKEMCKFHKIDFEMTRPKTPKGVEKPLGIFVREDDWSEFRTWGAKKYCYRSKEDGKLHLTVSGINKDAVLILEDNIWNFTEDLVFDKDFQMTNGEVKEKHPLYYDKNRSDDFERGVKKNLRIYCDDMPEVDWGDGYISNYKHATVLRPTSYSMSIIDEFRDMIYHFGRLKNYLKCIG